MDGKNACKDCEAEVRDTTSYKMATLSTDDVCVCTCSCAFYLGAVAAGRRVLTRINIDIQSHKIWFIILTEVQYFNGPVTGPQHIQFALLFILRRAVFFSFRSSCQFFPPYLYSANGGGGGGLYVPVSPLHPNSMVGSFFFSFYCATLFLSLFGLIQMAEKSKRKRRRKKERKKNSVYTEEAAYPKDLLGAGIKYNTLSVYWISAGNIITDKLIW